MKKITHKLWVKVLAFIICTAGGIGTMGSVIGIIFLSDFGAYSHSREKMQEEAFQSVARNYCAMLLEGYNEREENCNLDALEDITDNLEYAVYYCTEDEAMQCYWKGSAETEPLYRSSNLVSDQYAGLFQGGTTFRAVYSFTEEMPRAMFSSGRVDWLNENINDGYWEETEVSYFLFDKELFYAKTPMGYVEIPTLIIQKEVDGTQEKINCRIVRDSTGNNYYVDEAGKIVETSEYELWTKVSIGDVMLTMGAEVLKKDALPSGTMLSEVVVCEDLFEESDIILPEQAKYDGESLSYFLPYANDGKSLWVFYNISDPLLRTPDLDLFYQSVQWLDRVYMYRNLAVLVLVFSVFCLIAGFVMLMSASGKRDAEGVLQLRWLDRIPFAVLTAAVFLLETGLISLTVLLIDGTVYYNDADSYAQLGLYLFLGALLAAAMMVLFLGFCMSFAVRCKANCFWRYTLLHYILIPLKAFWRMCRENMPLMAAVIFSYLGICIAETAIFGYFQGYSYNGEVVLLLVEKACLGALVVVTAFQLHRLFRGGERVASGDSSKPIDTSGMFYHFKKHGEDINRIGDGIAAAVERQMKSERMKTELITNVSHDIKTPLTSIINYVDLMKKEEITDPTMIEYVDVLDRQSARLKKLIEDLMEASKASTGNLTVNMENFDATVLLTQFIGEFEERVQAAGLELVVSQPQPPVLIQADGRHLWRVVDNLMNNICKYAQPGTRVYIDMTAVNNRVMIMFRNISSARLNISSDELMERFVRGDSSRNTEGSGLGLSIALSLMQLMGGTMSLEVDGDLFKVKLLFMQVK